MYILLSLPRTSWHRTPCSSMLSKTALKLWWRTIPDLSCTYPNQHDFFEATTAESSGCKTGLVMNMSLLLPKYASLLTSRLEAKSSKGAITQDRSSQGSHWTVAVSHLIHFHLTRTHSPIDFIDDPWVLQSWVQLYPSSVPLIHYLRESSLIWTECFSNLSRKHSLIWMATCDLSLDLSSSPLIPSIFEYCSAFRQG